MWSACALLLSLLTFAGGRMIAWREAYVHPSWPILSGVLIAAAVARESWPVRIGLLSAALLICACSGFSIGARWSGEVRTDWWGFVLRDDDLPAVARARGFDTERHIGDSCFVRDSFGRVVLRTPSGELPYYVGPLLDVSPALMGAGYDACE